MELLGSHVFEYLAPISMLVLVFLMYFKVCVADGRAPAFPFRPKHSHPCIRDPRGCYLCCVCCVVRSALTECSAPLAPMYVHLWVDDDHWGHLSDV